MIYTWAISKASIIYFFRTFIWTMWPDLIHFLGPITIVTANQSMFGGPQDAIRILHHRFRGYTWNLIAGQPGKWVVNEVTEQGRDQVVYLASDAFASANDRRRLPPAPAVAGNTDFEIRALLLDHGIPTLGYLLQEKQRYNIDKMALAQLPLPPGPWLNSLKDFALTDEMIINCEQQKYTLGELRQALLRPKLGQSLAYLTDFLLDAASQQRLGAFLPPGCTIICESHYCHADIAHARQNYHVTATQAAELAKRVGAAKLILFHLSQRYQPTGMFILLQEARAIFPETHLPEQWLRE